MTRHLVVVEGGTFATVQDRGRPGWQRYGVPEGGAMDQLALFEGAALLGEAEPGAAIEMRGVGGSFTVNDAPLKFALSGAIMDAWIGDTRIRWNASHLLWPGETLRIGQTRRGSYGYLSLAGGIATKPQFGSRSTHVPSGLGGLCGRPLRSGDEIPLHDVPVDRTLLTLPDADRLGFDVLRIVPSFHDGAFEPEERDRFAEARFTVDNKADRMGIRLRSDGEPIRASDHLNVVSEAIVLGDIQIMGDGQPAILLADRQTTGGYPRVAAIITADLPRAAQMVPGATVRFKPVTHQCAVEALRSHRDEIAQLRSKLLPHRRDPWDVADLLSHQLISGAVVDEVLPWDQ